MKQVAVLSVLLTVSLVGSYLQWTSSDDAPKGDDAIALYTATAGDLGKLVWDSENVTVSLTKKNDQQGEYTWIEVTERKEVMPEPEEEDEPEDGEATEEGEGDEASEEADGDEGDETESEEDEPSPEPIIEEEKTAFLGNASAEDLWSKFGPLYAMRKLDTTDPNSAAFGLDSPDAKLQIERRSGPIEVAIGAETYGTKDRYIRYESGVYLLDDATLRPLQFGKTRLVERNLVPLKSNQTIAVQLAAGTDKAAFVQKNKDDPAAAYWARQDTPDDADDGAGTWVDKLFRLRVNEYVDAEVEATLSPVFTYVVTDGTEKWSVTVMQESAAISPEYYAKSQYNRGLVKLTKGAAGEVVADLETVLAGEGEE